MELEIYTTGGGSFLLTTFNALAALSATKDFAAMTNIGLLVGLFVVLFQLVWGGSFSEMCKMYCVVALVGGLSIGPKADVIIFDKTVGNLPIGTVANVPRSVAYVGHVTSTFSEVLTRRMEALLAPPTSLSYQTSGMLFGATLRARSARWRAVSATLHENMVNFLDQCAIDAVSLRYIAPAAIAQSGDLAVTLAAQMPQSLAYYDVVKQTTRLCKDGWPDIEKAIETDVDAVLGRQAAAIYQIPADPDDVLGVAAINRLKDQISDFAAFSGIGATDAVENIKQSMLIAALDDAATRSIASSTNAAAMEHLQAARAEAQTRSSYGAISTQALSWVPYLKIVFENLYYGAFPFALFMMMTPFCLTVVRGYFGGFVWLASWEPLNAVLHNIVLNAAVGDYRERTVSTTDGVADLAVVSWANHFGVYSVQQDIGAMAGYLMMSIPFIASVIFFGANRMVGLATSTLAVSQGAASEAGREVSTGNLSYGNASVGNRTFENYSAGNFSRDNFATNNHNWNNTSANRTVTSPYTDTGRRTTYTAGGAEITQNADGSVAINSGSMQSRTATSVGLGESIVGTLDTRASQAFEKSGQFRTAAERSSAQIESQTSSFMTAVTSGRNFTKSDGTRLSEDEQLTVSDAIGVVDRFAQSRNISRETALNLAVAARAGTPWKFLGGNVRSELRKSGVTADTYNAALESTRNSEMRDALTTLTSTFNSLSKTDQDSLSTTGDRGMRTSIDDVARAVTSAEVAEREAQAYTNASSKAQSQFVDGKIDLSQAFVDYVITGRGYSASQAADLLSGRPEFADEAQSLRSDFMEEYIQDIHTPEISEYISKPLPNSLPMHQGPDTEFAPGDYLDGRLKGFAEAQLDVETAIIKQRERQPGIEERGAPLAGEFDKRRDNVLGHATASSVLHDPLSRNQPFEDRTEDTFTMGRDGRVAFGPTENDFFPSALPLLGVDRDAVIRTVYGEAGGETQLGQAAVAHVIRNRVEDPGFAETAGDVVFAPRQFSVWNTDGSGNRLAEGLPEESPPYQQIGEIVDGVFGGQIQDPTGGATYYYSPEGMRDLVDSGYQPNEVPTWLEQTTEQRGGTNIRIGGHVFSGRVRQ